MGKRVYTGVFAKPDSEERTFELIGRMRESYRQLLPVKNKELVLLDIGCKGSWLEDVMHDKYKKIIATDLDQRFIDHLNELKPYRNVEYKQSDVSQKIDLPNNSVDRVAFLEVIEHLPKNTEPQALSEIVRVLKKGGKLVLTTPRRFWLTNLLDPAFWLIGHRHYREAQLLKWLKEAGFGGVEIQTRGRFFDAYSVFNYYLLRPFHLEKITQDWMIRLIQREYDAGVGYNHLIVTATK